MASSTADSLPEAQDPSGPLWVEFGDCSQGEFLMVKGLPFPHHLLCLKKSFILKSTVHKGGQLDKFSTN